MAISKDELFKIGQSWPVAQERIVGQITLPFYLKNATRIGAFSRNAFKLLFVLGELKDTEGNVECADIACEVSSVFMREWIALKAAFNDSFDARMYKHIYELKVRNILPRECTSVSDCFFSHLLKTESRFLSNLEEVKSFRSKLNTLSLENSSLKSELEEEKRRVSILSSEVKKANARLEIDEKIFGDEEAMRSENIDWFFSL